ncbi:MAG: NUDIX domain-containing protein [Clostridiales bacterium]|nr:NUDIX domain-containing protein [Clostridiales bacterium]
MRLLFEIDKKDYGQCTRTYMRDSARSIIIENGKVAMIRSVRYGYYKFPGGGIERGESPVAAMIRETREEAGLLVLPESVKEYGYVHRVQRSEQDETLCFVQDNYYYLCRAKKRLVAQALEEDEAREGFQLEFVEPALAIRKNRSFAGGPYNPVRLERAARILEMLSAEGLLASWPPCGLSAR